MTRADELTMDPHKWILVGTVSVFVAAQPVSGRAEALSAAAETVSRHAETWFGPIHGRERRAHVA